MGKYHGNNFGSMTPLHPKLRSVSVNGRPWSVPIERKKTTPPPVTPPINDPWSVPYSPHEIKNLFKINEKFESRNENVSVIYSEKEITVYTEWKFKSLIWNYNATLSNYSTCKNQIHLESILKSISHEKDKKIRMIVISEFNHRERKDYIEYSLTSMNRDLDDHTIDGYCKKLYEYLYSKNNITSAIDPVLQASKIEIDDITANIDIFKKTISVEAKVFPNLDSAQEQQLKEQFSGIMFKRETKNTYVLFSTSSPLKWCQKDWLNDFKWFEEKSFLLSQAIDYINTTFK